MNAAQIRQGSLVALAGLLAIVVGAFGYRWLNEQRSEATPPQAAPLASASPQAQAPQPSTTPQTPSPPASPAPANTPASLSAAQLASATIPGALCRSSAPIHLHDGTATNVPSTFDGPEDNMPQDVSAFTNKITYGDLTGDGHAEAALPVLCGNHNATAAGQTAMGILILDASHGRLDTIATLTSRQPRNGEPPNSLEITQISPGKITATDIYYQSTDANCCPSGKTTARWTYHNGTLTPDTP